MYLPTHTQYRGGVFCVVTLDIIVIKSKHDGNYAMIIIIYFKINTYYNNIIYLKQ